MGSAQRDFDDELLRLFSILSHQLRAYLWPTSGKTSQLTKRTLKRSIAKLQDIATNDYLGSKAQRRSSNHAIISVSGTSNAARGLE